MSVTLPVTQYTYAGLTVGVSVDSSVQFTSAQVQRFLDVHLLAMVESGAVVGSAVTSLILSSGTPDQSYGAPGQTYVDLGGNAYYQYVNKSWTLLGFLSKTDTTYTSGMGTAPPTGTSPPTITGSARAGQTLAASQGFWTGTPTSYAYQWSRGGTPIAGATSSTYSVVTADVGYALSVAVTAYNAGGSASAASVATSAVTAAPATTPPVTAVSTLHSTFAAFGLLGAATN